jgi:hypothetical protein
MGGVLSNPSVSKEQVQTMVNRQIVPIQNTSQSIDKKLNMVVTAITDQIMELKELMAQQKVDTVKELQGKLNSAERESQFSNPQDENSLERERQIEQMREQLEAAQSEANTARRNANSARREKNELNAQKQKANANLAAAKQAATNAQALVDREKEASAAALAAAQEASAKEKEAYLATTTEEKERLTAEAAALRNAAVKANVTAKSLQGERNSALEAKVASERALAAEREAKEAAQAAEQLAKITAKEMQSATNAEKANLQNKLKAAQNNAAAKRQEANTARANANSAKTNAKAAREEAELAKAAALNAQQAKANAEQAVSEAKAAAAKAQQNANAAAGEEKRKLKMIAERALRNLQEKQEELKEAKQAAVNVAGQLATAKEESGRLEANLLRAATEKTTELQRRVEAETKLSQMAKSPTYANVASGKARAAKPSWNSSTRVRGGKRKSYARRSNGKNRTRKH